MSGLFNRSGPGTGQRSAPPGQQQPRVPYDRISPMADDRYSGSIHTRTHYPGQEEQPRYSSGLPGGPKMQGSGQHHLRTQAGSGQMWQLKPAKSPSNEFTFGNIVAVSPSDFPLNRDSGDFYIILNDRFVLTARVFNGFPPGQLSLSEAQRSWARISLQEVVNVRLYNPFSEGGHCYLASVDAEVGFAGRRNTTEQIDQDELATVFIKNYENQVFAPEQKLIMDYKSWPLVFDIKTVSLGDLSMEKPTLGDKLTNDDARGILTQNSQMSFFKNAKTNINLKASKKRPAANAILQPNFKFEDMGIGGLDKEFSAIFRRAFASRIFPPGLIQNMGVQHVKGILLYGSPGTGKTLIARKIGQMLNAREPKVINGPEVLNKFVGQSEENIRKLFADAEKEYKEKGEESGLHIIIFDELDAVCKQRGSGAGGGTGVGDSIVNQLLSKLDGVDQLNNILLIGMTNRKDMIDDALLRPGRLEVHMEISLPDEAGRVQILKIHTAQMRKHGNLDSDVQLEEIAQLTKNFSGAEISGLVRSATSFALNRHVKVGSMAAVSEDIENMTVNRDDFVHAFGEVKPAFGVSEDDLHRCIERGILPFSSEIGRILREGQVLVRQIRARSSTAIYSAVLHGPPDSGKTALAARIALDSGYPFIKLCSAGDMMGFNEAMRIEHMRRIFDDAYKSPLSLVVIDNIERIIGWVPIGPRFDNSVLQALWILLKKLPPAGRRLLVLATTSEKSVLQQLDLFKSFDSNISVPNVGTFEELKYVLKHSGGFPDIDRAISELKTPSRNNVNVGIKRILGHIESAMQHDDVAESFARVMAMEDTNFASFIS